MNKEKPIIFVIDTSALFHQISFTAENIQLVTTPIIEKEMYRKGLKDSFELLKATEKLRILEPSPQSLEKVKKAAAQLGDLQNLSDPDVQLIALALDLALQDYSVVVLTDDYSIQNVAKQLTLDFKPASTSGIREIIKWEIYCGACGHKEPKLSQEEVCPVCGTALKRRAVRKQPV